MSVDEIAAGNTWNFFLDLVLSMANFSHDASVFYLQSGASLTFPPGEGRAGTGH